MHFFSQPVPLHGPQSGSHAGREDISRTPHPIADTPGSPWPGASDLPSMQGQRKRGNRKILQAHVGWRISPDRRAWGWDLTHWEDPIAHNTTKGRETGDQEERARLYQELAIKASEEAIYLPLYQFSPYFAMADNINNFYYHTMYGPDFWDVTK